jgi:ABC-type polysaccharide/polyol phosphate export permease
MTESVTRDLREIISEQIEYRALLYRLAQRDLLLRYKQAAMGFAWAVFMPLLNTAIFTVIFTRVAQVQTTIPYPVYAYCGLLTWNFTASTLKGAVVSLSTNATLVTKVYFPREVFPFSTMIVALVDLFVAALVLIGFMVYYRIGITWTVLFVPVILVVQILFTAGVALLLAMANLFYRDVKYVFEVIVTVWMFATSVVYPVDLVGGRLHGLLLLNPMTPIIDGYRATILRGVVPDPVPFALTAAVSLLCLVVCWLSFHRSEFRFAENI